jgi:trehalose-phosphatase
MTGKANLEVRPRFVNKGEIAKRLVLEYGEQPPEFVLCLGDDFTDEGVYICFPTLTKTNARRHVPFPTTIEAAR